MRYLIIASIIFVSCERTTKGKFDGKEYRIDNEAIALNDRAIAVFTENPDSLDYAIRLLGESIQLDSNYYLAYQNKINFEKDLEKYDFGIRTIKAFINRFPNNPSSYLKLGLRQEKNGDLREAKRSYRTARYLTIKSYEARNAKLDSVKDMFFILTYLNGDTARASFQFEKFKEDYDTLGNYQNQTLSDFIEVLR